MHSQPFDLPVVLTEHARLRVAERSIDSALVLEIIDTGIFKNAGSGHCWLYKHFDDRAGNLLCVVAVIENALVIKTIMHQWEPVP